MYEDEYPHEHERCGHRCEVHPYIPCSAGCVAHRLHRCVLCNPKRKPPQFREGERVTHTDRNGQTTALVVASMGRLGSGWAYMCRGDDRTRETGPYFERDLNPLSPS